MALSESGRLRFPAWVGGAGRFDHAGGGPGQGARWTREAGRGWGPQSQRQTLGEQKVLCQGSRESVAASWGP